MKNSQTIWMPATGFVSSVSIASVSNAQPVTEDIGEIIDVTHQAIATAPDHGVLWYLLVGFFGALGGLLLKIAWSLIKRKFPKLQNLDK
ncbi:hypothetical protein OU798_07305 [Prolixibacteraceae bacterium Z1-6]|uniref:Uncharacterized protein n=1 Tax=Draconibacterium aestuarii TaxID=2998507 RepID=A0A9X3FCM3_9BACT|nr:hypothetical protein [Prolixibacteraceae bacterium Z1-6]